MKKLTTRWYYSLEELLEMVNKEEGLGLIVYPDAVTDGENVEQGFGSVVDGMIDNAHFSLESLDGTESKKMFTSYLWPEFRNSIVLYVDSITSPWEEPAEPSYNEVYEALQEEVTRWARWYKDSYERFSVLIDAYKTIENTLLSRVTTVTSTEGESEQGSVSNGEDSSLNLRNDTPQEGGDFTADPYVNEATKHSGSSTNTNTINNSITSTSTVATDLNTPIERLNEVREKLHNLYADWADEFARFVVYSAE